MHPVSDPCGVLLIETMSEAPYLTPTTELEAVNTILRVMGDSPVSTLDTADPESAEAAIALQTLRHESRSVQTKGWHWNTEIELTVTPDVNGYINLPTNCLRVDSLAYLGGGPVSDVVVRGTRLYDRKKHTYVFPQPFKVDMVIMLPFEDLPEAARRFIAMIAAHRHQTQQLGSTTKANFSAEEVAEARLDLEQAEGETSDFNQLHNNPHMARLYRHRRVT